MSNKQSRYAAIRRDFASRLRYVRQNPFEIRLVRCRAKSSVHHILQISRLEQLPSVFSNHLRSKSAASPTSTISFTLLIESDDAKIECISECVFSQAVNSISLASRPAITPTCAGSATQTQTRCADRRSASRPASAAVRRSPTRSRAA